MKHLLTRIIILVVLLVALVLFILAQSNQATAPSATSDIQTDLSASYTNASQDLIVVSSPTPGEILSSPLTITGEARGTWYFEAIAPISLVNWDGVIVAEGYVTAQGNWMTEDFVPFEGTLEFTTEAKTDSNLFLYPQGVLILHNDNPSGLPENDRAIEIPIRFE